MALPAPFQASSSREFGGFPCLFLHWRRSLFRVHAIHLLVRLWDDSAHGDVRLPSRREDPETRKRGGSYVRLDPSRSYENDWSHGNFFQTGLEETALPADCGGKQIDRALLMSAAALMSAPGSGFTSPGRPSLTRRHPRNRLFLPQKSCFGSFPVTHMLPVTHGAPRG